MSLPKAEQDEDTEKRLKRIIIEKRWRIPVKAKRRVEIKSGRRKASFLANFSLSAGQAEVGGGKVDSNAKDWCPEQ